MLPVRSNLAAITPFGKFGLPVPKSVPLRVMNVKIPLPHIPMPSKEEVRQPLDMRLGWMLHLLVLSDVPLDVVWQVAHWVEHLEIKAKELIADHPQPDLDVAPIHFFQPPVHQSKL